MKIERLLIEKDKEYMQFLKTRIFDDVPKLVASKMLKYALSKEEHEKVLNKIECNIFKNIEPQESPNLHLIISQTGGGKTALKQFVKSNISNVLDINSDDFKKENPLSEIILNNTPSLYGYLTALDSCLHRDEIIEKAVRQRMNVVLDVAPSVKHGLFNVDLLNLQKLGYEIHFHILAVSLTESLLSVFERYEKQIQNNSINIKVPNVERLIDSYCAVELLAKDLEAQKFQYKLYSRVDLSNQAKKTTFSIKEVELDENKSLLENLEIIRNGELKKSEILDRFKIIENQMQKRNASKLERKELKKALKIVKIH